MTRRIHDETADAATVSFDACWRRAVAGRGDHPFLVFEAPSGSVTTWSYGEFDDVVGRTAGLLLERGAGPGRAVHLALTNGPTFVAVWLAAVRVGAWIVPSDPMSTAPELAEHLTRTRAGVGFASSTRADTYRSAVTQVVVAGVSEPTVVVVDEAATAFEWLPAIIPGPSVRPPDPLDRAAVMFTSGTTGRPKGVEITQANYAFAGSVMADAAGLGSDDRQLVVLPMFHANAQYYSFAAAIAVGASVALMNTFSASGFLAQAARHGATHASLFAGPMRMILARGAALAPDHQPPLELRHCWFAQNVTDEQYTTLTSWLGCRPRQLYGMTETIPAVLTDLHDEPRPDLMGGETPGCRVDLHDPDGGPVPPGDVGEIVVAGRRGVELFAGYLDDPETTEASFRVVGSTAWFRTGDRAVLHDDGRYRFDGRRSDVLKVSGENVSVVEVETVLSVHPDVLEVCVVGRPDPIRDEVPVAFVVPAPDRDVAPHDLVVRLTEWCEDRLVKAKRPRSITVVDELPRTSVGKIRKFMLNEEDHR